MKEVETAFGQTTKLLFGKSFSPLSKYVGWLLRDSPGCRYFETSKEKVPLANVGIYKHLPIEKITGNEIEAENEKKRLELGDFRQLCQELEKMGKVVCEVKEGTNENVHESNFYLNAQNCYRLACCFHTKMCAYNIWSSYNEYTFGCYRNMNSTFSLKCYFSTYLTRCVEMDSCRNCSDSMFCHNSEGLRDSLFCFNVKSLRYAVLNQEVGKENYEKMKKLLMNKLISDLDGQGSTELGIYHLLGGRK
jgi:hypothetical protein